MINPSTMERQSVDGLAEALLVAMLQVRDSDGKATPVFFSSDMTANISIAKQVASRLLGELTP